jgi:MFS family permease
MPAPRFFSKEAIYAPPGFNRWRTPPASIAIHLCIGSAYAWSIFNPALTKVRGVVAESADDWSLQQVIWIFTVAIVVLGLSAAVAGKWLERVGPRTVGIVAACCWSGGFVLASLGVGLQQLWLLYLGYGVIGGCGLGLGYVSPVSTLIRWFPDRRGMATGMAIMGFGGGAIIATPIQEHLLATFYRAPTYVGASDAVTLETAPDGRRLALAGGQKREVVEIGPAEAKKLPGHALPGVYVVGTGDSGVAKSFLVLAAAYFLVMLAAALSYRLPAPGWQPTGWAPSVAESKRQLVTTRHVDATEALRTPQFYLLWIVLCFNVTAGIGVLSVAKTMMGEIFHTSLPQIVTDPFSATYVLMISLFNMLGRFFWASASDYLGRKLTYAIFFGAGVALYLSIPWIAIQTSVSPGVTWLVLFYAVTMLIFTMYGGGFATIPAYLADLFGTRNVGAIHGRLLTAWSTAGVLGPLAITELRERSLLAAIENLARTVSPARFAERFGAGLDQLPNLVEKKTVTIAKLLELAPPGTADPSATLYNTTMFLMAALLAVGFVSNALVRPVDPKHYLSE